MKQLSEKITEYVIKTGAVSSESYDIYQYGFQIGLEMLCCFVTCLSIATYMHMIPEFAIFTGIFMLLRTYAGGVHLNSFVSCFICSVTVQTMAMYFNSKYKFTVGTAWILILVSAILILKAAPVECINRELDDTEKNTVKSNHESLNCCYCICWLLYTCRNTRHTFLSCTDFLYNFDLSVCWYFEI